MLLLIQKGEVIMLKDRLEKQPTKNEMAGKVEAFKTLNSILVKANAEFMATLRKTLTEKETSRQALEEKLKGEEGTSDENAEFLFLSGYTQALKDILNAGKKI